MEVETLVREVRRHASEISRLGAWAEQHGRLHPDAIALLRSLHVPRLCLPRGLGGLEVTPSDCALICEVLADADSAAAWHVMVYNAARLMAAGFPQETVEALWGEDPDVMVAASGHTPLEGVRTDTGFVVSGRNSFVSGAHHAEYMMGPMFCDGEMFTAIVPMASCRIIDNWDTLGMRGTGSNDVAVEGVELLPCFAVPQSSEPPRNAYYTGTLYDCPSRIVFATYIPVALSLARRALAELADLAADKVPYASDRKLKARHQAQMHYGRALGKFRAVRGYFYGALQSVWQRASAAESFDRQDRADLYLAGTHTLQTCAEVVRHVADAAGTSVLIRGEPLERIQRDMETLRHHGFANESRYASVAQVKWGAELDYPLLLR